MRGHPYKKAAQELRKNATKEERRLWYEFLKEHPLHFHRQKILGCYIVDFYCPAAKLVIELDGSQHYEEQGILYDRQRTDYLTKDRGLRVLRFTNLEICSDFEAVCDAIDAALYDPSSAQCAHWAPSPQGEGVSEHKENPMKQVTIYTDGACSGNPGPGGWGAILMYGPHKKELSGGEANTTNNRMELTGVIEALRCLNQPCAVHLVSDSKYVIDGLSKGWARGWKARGWVKSDKKPALNPDLWEELLRLTDLHQMSYEWVKGHAVNEYNNRCDEMAVEESRKFK